MNINIFNILKTQCIRTGALKCIQITEKKPHDLKKNLRIQSPCRVLFTVTACNIFPGAIVSHTLYVSHRRLYATM